MKYNVSINVSEVQEPNEVQLSNTIGPYYGNGASVSKTVEAESEAEAISQVVEKLTRLV